MIYTHGLARCKPANLERPRFACPDRELLILVSPFVSQVLVAQKVTAGVYRGVTTSELDELAAEQAASMTSMHPDYALVCAYKSCC